MDSVSVSRTALTKDVAKRLGMRADLIWPAVTSILKNIGHMVREEGCVTIRNFGRFYKSHHRGGIKTYYGYCPPKTHPRFLPSPYLRKVVDERKIPPLPGMRQGDHPTG